MGLSLSLTLSCATMRKVHHHPLPCSQAAAVFTVCHVDYPGPSTLFVMMIENIVEVKLSEVGPMHHACKW